MQLSRGSYAGYGRELLLALYICKLEIRESQNLVKPWGVWPRPLPVLSDVLSVPRFPDDVFSFVV